TAPTPRPTLPSFMTSRSAAGKAAPSKTVGTKIRLAAATVNRADMAASSLFVATDTTCAVHDCHSCNHVPKAPVARRPTRPAALRRRPKAPQGFRTRSACRAYRELPRARPARYVESTTEKEKARVLVNCTIT